VPGEHPLIEPSEILNTAVFAPMPGANMSTATAVKPEFFNSWRTA